MLRVGFVSGGFFAALLAACASVHSVSRGASGGTSILLQAPMDVVYSLAIETGVQSGFLLASENPSAKELKFRRGSYSTGAFLCSGHILGVFLSDGGQGNTRVEVVERLVLATQVLGCQDKASGFVALLHSKVGSAVTTSHAQAGTTGDTEIGLVEYRGTRQRIRAVGTRCAIMPLQAVGVDQQVAAVMDEVLLTELQVAGFEAIGPNDINTMLGFERTKEAVGCDDLSCFAEIGGALGVDYITAGNLARIDGSPMVTLKLMDVRSAKILVRVNRMGSQSFKEVPRLLAEVVQEIVRQSNL